MQEKIIIKEMLVLKIEYGLRYSASKFNFGSSLIILFTR